MGDAMRVYDTLVLGAGGGGYPAAFRLARHGQQVLMVDEKGNLGGHCLYEGCIPSKAIRESARLLARSQHTATYGLAYAVTSARPWEGARAYKEQVQTRRYAQHAEEVAAARGLTLVRGRGRFLDPHTAEITDINRGEQFTVRFRYALVATGSHAVTLPIPGGADTWTSHDLFAWQEAVDGLPARLIVIGGGYIGVEAAFMLAAFGVRVTVLEATPGVLPQMDPEIAAALTPPLRAVADVRTGARVTAIRRRGGGVAVTLAGTAGEETLEADAVLTAVGRAPNVEPELGLEAAGVAFDRHGIRVDSALRTSMPHIFAAGDVTGLSMLFHSAVRMSEVAAANILADPALADTFDPLTMPATVFASPEAHTVGLTLAQATARNLRAHEIRRPMGVEARAQIEEETEGFIKMVVEDDTGVILGVHAVGADAANLAAVSHILVQNRLTVADVARLTFPHPTQFEVIDRLARQRD
ncbi:MAG: dihydrolipoyl dehydrogenase [Firmicutes bacterium]|nr:dihydrolipoyl dehydrogenase [Bacillota bacterium]